MASHAENDTSRARHGLISISKPFLVCTLGAEVPKLKLMCFGTVGGLSRCVAVFVTFYDRYDDFRELICLPLKIRRE